LYALRIHARLWKGERKEGKRNKMRMMIKINSTERRIYELGGIEQRKITILSDVMAWSLVKFANVSEERTTSIFRVEEQTASYSFNYLLYINLSLALLRCEMALKGKTVTTKA
jgi:hypothetical protein